MPRTAVPTLPAVAGLLLVAPLLAACGSGGSSETSSSSTSPTSSDTVALTATDTACEVARDELPAGPVTFAVTNKGSSITEAYVYARAGDRYSKVVSEVENIGPGTSRNLSVSLAAGSYELACKPGQSGDGIRTPITVGGGDSGAASAAPSASAATPSAGASESGYDREIELSTDGRSISGLSGPAKVGERIEFKLRNGAGGPRVLELKEPDGSVAGETEPIAPGRTGETVQSLDEPGTWTVIVEGDGVEDVTAALPVR